MTTIGDLRPTSSGLDLCVKVIDTKVVVDRPKGNKSEGLKVAECLVGDQTGCIVLSVRNEQVEKAQPGAYISLTNAKVDMFKGSMRLIMEKSGQVEEASGQKFSPKTDNNMSLLEFELVSLDRDPQQ